MHSSAQNPIAYNTQKRLPNTTRQYPRLKAPPAMCFSPLKCSRCSLVFPNPSLCRATTCACNRESERGGMDAAAATPSNHSNGTKVLAAQTRQRYVPILPRPPSPEPPPPPPPPPVVDQRLAPALSDASGERVTPDEVLTLGVLALAGLWPGTWAGIAAIIVKQVDRLAQNDGADIPFRRCAISLVDMLLKTPGDPTVAVETWRHLAAAQARLPEDLSQVLGLACSLLQSRTMEAADVRARKKRRRIASADTVATISTAPAPLTPPCATALVVMVGDMGREEDETRRREQAEEEEEGEEEEGRARLELENEPGLLTPPHQMLSLPMPLTPETPGPGVHIGHHMSPPPPTHSHGYEPALQMPLASPGHMQNSAAPWGVGEISSTGSSVDLGTAGPATGGAAPSPINPAGLVPHPPPSQRSYVWDVSAGSQMEYYPSPDGQFSPQRQGGGGEASPRGSPVAGSSMGGDPGSTLP